MIPGVQLSSVKTTTWAAVRVIPWEEAVRERMAQVHFGSFWNLLTASYLLLTSILPSILI